MERLIYKNLLNWKKDQNRQPLLLKGARQVGKSYILKAFGEREFKNYYFFNFEKDKKIISIFEPDLQPERIIRELSISIGKNIDVHNDLIIFDEIQECPKAITSLKYFSENMPELAVCCAGSLIGVMLSSESFPVGKVEFLNLFPMNFEEFLMALNDDMSLELLNNLIDEKKQSKVSHDRLWKRLKEYFVIGGMPGAVSIYVSNRDNMTDVFNYIRKIQDGIINSYNKDFAKHSGKTNSMHIVSVFSDVPMQLSRNMDGSVKRYRFKGAIPNKKSFIELQGPIEWLVQAGLVIKVKTCNRAELPLKAFCKNNIFKLFIFDVGLLGAMLEIPIKSIISEDYGITKGYFAENFVVQELMSAGLSNIYSWTERNSEIEFLKVIDGEIVPIEVKSGKRTQAKSLAQYIKKYKPGWAIKMSAEPLEIMGDGIIHKYPLYLAGKI